MDRPQCQTEGCTNQARKRYRDGKVSYLRFCAKHIAIRYGSPKRKRSPSYPVAGNEVVAVVVLGGKAHARPAVDPLDVVSMLLSLLAEKDGVGRVLNLGVVIVLVHFAEGHSGLAVG